MFKYWAVLIYHSLRYIRAKRRGKTLRLKVNDFKSFSNKLNNTGVPILVLRWWNVIPCTDDEKKKYVDDIDCLIDENNIWPIIKLAAKNPGTSKVDLYGICGRNGTSYRGMPYYPPILAKKIYESRIWGDGYYTPSLDMYKYSFIYHVVYHKGPESNINFSQIQPEDDSNKFYRELTSLRESDAVLKSNEITLVEMHNYLKSFQWSMPLDLMSRWNGNKDTITKLIKLEELALSHIVKQLKGLTIFIIRDDAYIKDSIETIRSMLSKKFQILTELKLTKQQSNSIMNNTRGGNWIEKRKESPTEPTEMWICRPKYKNSSASKKMKKRYPLIENFEVLIKREIRSEVNKIDDTKRVVIHASDNDIESAIIFNSAFGKKAEDEIRKLQMML